MGLDPIAATEEGALVQFAPVLTWLLAPAVAPRWLQG